MPYKHQQYILHPKRKKTVASNSSPVKTRRTAGSSLQDDDTHAIVNQRQAVRFFVMDLLAQLVFMRHGLSLWTSRSAVMPRT
ncbi:hypothetical protein PoB_004578000 [Plakobranchus ocellatus]|uniref:Uncharacterized protein n=1 Tax=Plakobranchus ocellatus TaxID=259542 RepID=A0AAV4BJR4_9GAST|nr:hypothetical protein PoB_004578000 [Plakobranchus ocellatus]